MFVTYMRGSVSTSQARLNSSSPNFSASLEATTCRAISTAQATAMRPPCSVQRGERERGGGGTVSANAERVKKRRLRSRRSNSVRPQIVRAAALPSAAWCGEAYRYDKHGTRSLRWPQGSRVFGHRVPTLGAL